jgi:two-component system LytT family response regulator
MNRIRTIIVDDESKSRNTLSGILKKYFEHVEIIAECSSGEEAYARAVELKPALVFLDIEMPFGNGFDFLAKFDQLPFEVIFLTAYDQYALKAVKASALDYLLKPLSIGELNSAIAKAEIRLREKNSTRQYQLLLRNSNPGNGQFQNLAIPTQYGLEFLEVKNIILLEAEGNYTMLHLPDNKKSLSTRALKEYEELLPETNFFRAHHSYIINIAHIKKYYKGEGGHVVMSNGASVTIAKRKKKEFLERLGA